jgi:hypothetical protein
MLDILQEIFGFTEPHAVLLIKNDYHRVKRGTAILMNRLWDDLYQQHNTPLQEKNCAAEKNEEFTNLVHQVMPCCSNPDCKQSQEIQAAKDFLLSVPKGDCIILHPVELDEEEIKANQEAMRMVEEDGMSFAEAADLVKTLHDTGLG